MNKDMQVTQINLNDKEERSSFSKKLQDMEGEFSYPLGNKTFYIKHGFNTKQYDYFSYFEQLGLPYFYVIEKDNKVIGCLCFILRNIENKKVWYICDLKIIKEEQSKKIVFILYNILKNKLSAITTSYYFINMCPVKNNGLFKLANKVLKGFNMDIQPLYIYEVDKNNALVKNKVVGSNRNKKDIVIDNKQSPLYHLINDIECRTKCIEKIDSKCIEENASVMFCSYEKIEELIPSSIGAFAHSGMEELKNLSTFEI